MYVITAAASAVGEIRLSAVFDHVSSSALRVCSTARIVQVCETIKATAALRANVRLLALTSPNFHVFC